jgi:hypothetical protein
LKPPVNRPGASSCLSDCSGRLPPVGQGNPQWESTVGLAWSHNREQTVLMVIAVLDDAGRDVTSDSIYEFIAQRTIDLGPLPPGTSVIHPGFSGGSIAWKGRWSHGRQQGNPSIAAAVPA